MPSLNNAGKKAAVSGLTHTGVGSPLNPGALEAPGVFLVPENLREVIPVRLGRVSNAQRTATSRLILVGFHSLQWDEDEPPRWPGRQNWAGKELYKTLGWDNPRNLSPATFTPIKREIIPKSPIPAGNPSSGEGAGCPLLFALQRTFR